METVEGRCRWRTERLRTSLVIVESAGAGYSSPLSEGCWWCDEWIVVAMVGTVRRGGLP